MSKFSVGEIAVGQNFNHDAECNGMEGEIIGELKIRTSTGRTTGIVTTELKYVIKWKDWGRGCVRPYNLRKKKPPQIKMGDWELIEIGTGWSPFKVTAPKEKQNV